MGWNDVSNESASNGPGNFLQLKDGTNTAVRVMSEPEVYKQHWVQVAGKKRPIKCPGSPNCPLCNAGERPQERHLFVVIDRATLTPKLLDIPRTAGVLIKQLFIDPSWGSPLNYDVSISREAAGNQTRYSVLPRNPIMPPTPQEQALVNEFVGRVNYKEFVQPNTPAEIAAILRGEDIKQNNQQKNASYGYNQAPTTYNPPPPPQTYQQPVAQPPQPMYQPQPPQYQQQPQVNTYAPMQPPPQPAYQQPVQPMYQTPTAPPAPMYPVNQAPQQPMQPPPPATAQRVARPGQPVQPGVQPGYNPGTTNAIDKEIFG
jgi:hypothetical protein